jgi:hypothetical protein
MVPPRRPSRPGRPARPGSASARRQPAPRDEVPEGEEGEDLEELPPAPQGPSVTMMVGLGAALLFSILFAIFIFKKRDCLIEVENMSIGPLQKVAVKINGETYEIGDMMPNSVGRSRARCTPGDDVELTYVVPNRGPLTRKLPKRDIEGNATAPDFANYKGRFRIRIEYEGIKETEFETDV